MIGHSVRVQYLVYIRHRHAKLRDIDLEKIILASDSCCYDNRDGKQARIKNNPLFQLDEYRTSLSRSSNGRSLSHAKKTKDNLLQTPGIEPGTVCAANRAHVATDC